MSNTLIWTKIGDHAYRIADGYTEGAVSDCVDIAQTKPYSVEQFLSAEWLVVSVVPFTKAKVVATNLSSNLIQKSDKWFKVIKTKITCNCFTAGTTVLTDEGEKNIENIEVGDRILAKSEYDSNGELAYKEVTALYRDQRDDIIKLYVGE